MLGRSADALFWLARYVERADNLARLIDVGRRTATLGGDGDPGDWDAILRSAGCAASYYDAHGEAVPAQVVGFLLHSLDTPSSIRSCMRAARENARIVRTSLTTEMWEVLNETWLEMRGWQSAPPGAGWLRPSLEWIKRRCALFRGVTESTVLRHEGYDFLRLGTYLERGDCTARILDVRNEALDIGEADRGAAAADAITRHHWIAILRATSSVRAYHWVHHSDYDPRNIVDLLVMNAYCSRSLAHCIETASERLERLARIYARRHESHGLCRSLLDELRANDLDAVLAGGLHEYLASFIARNHALSNQIALDYHFGPVVAAEGAGGVT
jgi:uncharacterized alpha-E superfamily protein